MNQKKNGHEARCQCPIEPSMHLEVLWSQADAEQEPEYDTFESIYRPVCQIE